MGASMGGELSISIRRSFSCRRDDLQLDGDGRRQLLDTDGRARRLNLPEVLGIDLIETREVTLHVDEVDGDVENLLERAPRLLQDGPDVGDRRTGLNLDVVIDHAPGFVAQNAGNLTGAGLAWPYPRQEEQIAHASGVRIGTNGRRSLVSTNGAALVMGLRERGRGELATCLRSSGSGSRLATTVPGPQPLGHE